MNKKLRVPKNNTTATDSDDLALATLACMQGGLVLTQIHRSTKPLATAIDAAIRLIEHAVVRVERG